jgi:hypothetical protein
VVLDAFARCTAGQCRLTSSMHRRPATCRSSLLGPCERERLLDLWKQLASCVFLSRNGPQSIWTTRGLGARESGPWIWTARASRNETRRWSQEKRGQSLFAGNAAVAPLMCNHTQVTQWKSSELPSKIHVPRAMGARRPRDDGLDAKMRRPNLSAWKTQFMRVS